MLGAKQLYAMKNIKTKLSSYLLSAVMVFAAGAFFAALPQSALAAEQCGSKQVHNNAPDTTAEVAVGVGCSGSGNPIYDYARGVMAFLALGVGIVVVGALIFGGIAYASASGDKGQVEKAKEIIMNAIIGLLLFIGMAAILNFVIPGGLFT